MSSAFYNAGFRALKVVQVRASPKLPAVLRECHLTTFFPSGSRASRADGHTSSHCPAGLCISTFLSLFPALFVRAVSESPAVNAKAGRVDDFLKDIKLCSCQEITLYWLAQQKTWFIVVPCCACDEL